MPDAILIDLNKFAKGPESASSSDNPILIDLSKFAVDPVAAEKQRILKQATTKPPTLRPTVPGLDTPRFPEGFAAPGEAEQPAPPENLPSVPIAQAVQNLPTALEASVNLARQATTSGPKRIIKGFSELPPPPEAGLANYDPVAAGSKAASSLHEILSGGFETARPLLAYGGIAAPLQTALRLGAGILGKEATTRALKASGVPDEYSEAAGDIVAILAPFAKEGYRGLNDLIENKITEHNEQGGRLFQGEMAKKLFPEPIPIEMPTTTGELGINSRYQPYQIRYAGASSNDPASLPRQYFAVEKPNGKSVFIGTGRAVQDFLQARGARPTAGVNLDQQLVDGFNQAKQSGLSSRAQRYAEMLGDHVENQVAPESAASAEPAGVTALRTLTTPQQFAELAGAPREQVLRVLNEAFPGDYAHMDKPELLDTLGRKMHLSDLQEDAELQAEFDRRYPHPGGERPAETPTTEQPISVPLEEFAREASEPKSGEVNEGSLARVKTALGTTVDTRYAVVPASSVVTSHDANGEENPAYPKELQQRDRSRKASQAQVQSIADNLDPEEVAASYHAANGAPIIGEDRVVESGNGRSNAIKLIYQGQHPNAAKYRNWLVDNAQRFGIDPAVVQSIENPMLVRIRQSPVENRAQFAAEANIQSTGAFSPSETAKSDAAKLTPEVLQQFTPGEDGDISAPRNREFVRNFFAAIPESERALYQTADGGINQAGVARIRNVIFARVYGDAPALQHMAESVDSNIRNVTNGMLQAAGRLAKAQQAIGEGSLHDLPIGQDVAAAASKLSQLRQSGQTVKDYLQQRGLFGEDLSPEASRLLGILDTYKRSAGKIADLLNHYVNALEAAGDPRAMSMFGAPVTPTRSELLETAYERAEGRGRPSQPGQTSFLEGKPPGGSPVAAEPAVAQGETEPAAASEAAGAFAAPAPAISAPAQSASERGAISPQLLNVVTLGVADTLVNDVGAAVVSAAKGVAETAAGIRDLVAPTTNPAKQKGRRVAEVGELVLRRRLGELDRKTQVARNALVRARAALNALPEQDRLDFIDRIENGLPQPTPALQTIADVLRQMLDDRRSAVQALGTGKLRLFYTNYFPHLWENPKQAQNVIQQFYGKRPLEGSKSFLKKRTHMTFKDGLTAGLKPVTTSPVDMVLLKVAEMDRYVMAHQVRKDFKRQGLVGFYRSYKQAPKDSIQIADPIGTVYGRTKKGLIIRGTYRGAPAAVRLLNNYLSPGLRQYALYRGLFAANNWMNNLQLGLSAFHLGFTTIDATTSKLALGIEQLMRGQPIAAARTMAEVPVSPITTFLKGDALLRAYSQPGAAMSPFKLLLDNVVAGMTPAQWQREAGPIAGFMEFANAHARMDQLYATHIAQKMVDAFKRGNLLKGTVLFPFAAIEQLARPIMEYIVPRQKLGVFFDKARYDIERLGSGATAQQVQRALVQAWDSVENRMGQMTYDNLFWHKTFKDAAMLATRSVGWNLGTIRELGGAATDVVRIPLQMGFGGNKYANVNLNRLSYAIALPIILAVLGAMYQKLRSGHGPTELKDYMFPKNGELDREGRPERTAPPTYGKDIYHYLTEPLRTITNKIAPIWSMMLQMIENQDYYGTRIRNEDDPILKQLLDEAKFVGLQHIPFAWRSPHEDRKLIDRAAQFVGITPAPMSVNQTGAERLAGKLARASMAPGTRTHESAARHDAEMNIYRAARKVTGARTDAERQQNRGLLSTAVADGLQSGNLSPHDVVTTLKSVTDTPLEREFKRLGVEAAAQVWRAATKEERDALEADFRKKISNFIKNRSDNEVKAMLPRVKAAIDSPPAH